MKRSFNSAEEQVGSTRQAILDAALRVLGRDGFGALSARSIAAEAGTNLALLNYYFGSKDQLLLAIFDALDAQRLGRQRAMYSAEAPLSAKWRQAVAYYRQDLADGYVRILQELTAHGYSNSVVGQCVRERQTAWRALLAEVAGMHLPELGIRLPPLWVASALASFWYGMETQHLAGATEEEGEFFAILDAIGDWLERRERETGLRVGADGQTGETSPDGWAAEGRGERCERGNQMARDTSSGMA